MFERLFEARVNHCAALSFLLLALAPPSAAGDLVSSGFEPGEKWNGTSWVVASSWPGSFQGGYALHSNDSTQLKKWPTSGSMSAPTLSIRLHFRVESDRLALDPNHDELPIEQITMVGLQPKSSSSKRPNVGLRRNDDMLVLRVEDYSRVEVLRDVVIAPDRWYVLDFVVDQPNGRMIVALDGVTVFDNPAADIVHAGKAFSLAEFGIVYATVNGHSLWFDDVRIRDTAALQGPELDGSATATPGVGRAPLTTSFAAATTAGSPVIDWDFEGDGTIDASGWTASHQYATAGTYRPVARITNGSGRRAAYPPVIHVAPASAPTVTLQLARGGSTTLPFPRLLDFRADATPASGAKLTKVEFDWEGDGVYGFDARTPWSDALPITVRLPHKYPFDTTAATARVKVTDDAGRSAVAELLVALPVGAGQPVVPARDSRAGIYLTYGWPEIYNNRGNQLPGWIAGMDVGAYYEWSVIESADNSFNFGPLNGSNTSTYNGRVNQILNSGKNVILHHRRPFPAWLFSKVGKSKKKNVDGDDYPQFWDPRYQSYLRRFVQAQAANLQALVAFNPAWQGRFVLERGQWFAIDSERLPTGQFPVVAYPGTSAAMNLTAANFTPPASGAYPVDFTPELATVYAATVRSIYEDAFAPLGLPSVFKPSTAGGWWNGFDSVRADDEFRRAVSNAGQGFFITNAKAETAEDHFYVGFTDQGFARGFHEADNASSLPLSTVQWQYWTLLAELNCGSEYVGTYGDHAWLLEYQSGYESEPIHGFINRHVGWKAHPAQAPSAWIALKQLTAPAGITTYQTGTYGAFLTEVPDDGSDVTSIGSVAYTYTGPGNLGHPTTLNEPMRYARSCPPGGSLDFDVDDAFRAGHADGWDLEIVFHDNYQGVFFVKCKRPFGADKYFVVPMSGDGKWHRAVVPMKSVRLKDDIAPGVDFSLIADTQATLFHRLVLTPR